MLSPSPWCFNFVKLRKKIASYYILFVEKIWGIYVDMDRQVLAEYQKFTFISSVWILGSILNY